ncbi:MAG: glycoside hydrolase family 113 [Fibrobacterota bacterium]|nr:hypothetical protein [Chitinispirillaceae bacterium]
MHIKTHHAIKASRFHVAFLFVALLLTACSDISDKCTYDPAFNKGFTVFFMPPRNSFNDSDFTEHIYRMKSDGVNSLYLTPSYFQKTDISDSIFRTSETLADSLLIRAIQIAKNAGIQVSLKPHINCLNNTPRSQISPSNYTKWLESYKQCITHYFTLSEAFDLHSFVAGTELDNVSENSDFFRFLDSLRNVSSTPILYACSYNHFFETKIWKHVDILGINTYYNLDNNVPPSEMVIRETWNFWLNKLEQESVIHNVPVVITEAGFMSRSTSAVNPGDFSGKPVCNETVQKMCYEALLSQTGLFTSIKGIYFWQWELGEKGRTDSCDYTPRNKRAEDIVKEYWGN